MDEICFCGWSGELAERRPVYGSNGAWGLACPRCGQVDPLHWLAAPARHALLAEAARRRREQDAVLVPASAAATPVA